MLGRRNEIYGVYTEIQIYRAEKRRRMLHFLVTADDYGIHPDNSKLGWCGIILYPVRMHPEHAQFLHGFTVAALRSFGVRKRDEMRGL